MKRASSERKKRIVHNRGKYVAKTIWIVFQVLLVLFVMSMFFAGGMAAGFFASNVSDEPLRSYDEIHERFNDYNQTGEMFDRNYNSLGDLRTTLDSIPVEIDRVSPHLKNAILATEDDIFYEHDGINVRALGRVAMEQVTSPGESTGGSTITQQLVKNQLLDPQRTVERKFQEMLLAMRVERMFPKDDILEAYINIVYMGFNANGTNIEGMGAAAEGIFGKDIGDLNIAESAYLAGMIHSPGRYTPFNRNTSINETRLQRGIDRARFVMRRMLETGRIDEDDYAEAYDYDFRSNLTQPTPASVERYPYLAFEVENQVMDIIMANTFEENDIDPTDLSAEEMAEYEEYARRVMSRGGLQVHTTIDQDLYEAYHALVQDDALFGETSTYIDDDGEEVEQIEQVASTLIDNETGAILAMIEGRDFQESEYNLALNYAKSPGSTIKPWLDYAIAFDHGIYQPASVIDDAPIALADGSPVLRYNSDTGRAWPTNFISSRFYGLGTVREAIARSHNVSAFIAYHNTKHKLGSEVLYEYLQKMNVTNEQSRNRGIGQHEVEGHDSLPLGGVDHGVTVLQNTGAYSTFANGGEFKQPYLIERIETADGNVFYEHEPHIERVFSEQTAFLMTDVLRSVLDHPLGTARQIRSLLGPELDIAGKTGTSSSYHDYWFVGYTPRISLGVWLGYEKTSRLDDGYSDRLQTIWAMLLEETREIRGDLFDPDDAFEMPENIVRQTVCSKSGLLPSSECQQAGYLVTDYFNQDFVPTQADDVVGQGRTVIVNGEAYIAHDSTPDDFVEEGAIVKREPLVIPPELEHERWRYIPDDRQDGDSPSDIDPREDNGQTPPAPGSVQVQQGSGGAVVQWNRVGDNDIAGYRLYRTDPSGSIEHIASIPDHEDMTYTDSNATEISMYFVTAVDIAGRESDPSDLDEQMEMIDEIREEEETDEEDSDEERSEDENGDDDRSRSENDEDNDDENEEDSTNNGDDENDNNSGDEENTNNENHNNDND